MKILPLSVRVMALSAALLAGAAQAAPATYQFKVWSPGLRAPVTTGPTTPPTAGLATGVFEPLDSSDFGAVRVGSTEVRSFRFTNTGKGSAFDIRAAVVHEDLSISASSCGTGDSPVIVAPSASCEVSVAYSPRSAEPLQATLAIGGAYTNTPLALTLTGQGVAEAIGVFEPASSSDFGAVTLGSTAARTFTFRNTGNAPATSVAVQVPIATGLAVSSNTCGNTSAPVTVAAGASCSISLTYGGSTAATLGTAPLRVSGNFTGAAQELLLTGTVGNFIAAGAWSFVRNSKVAPTVTDLNFGNRTPGTTATKSIYIRNVGANGGMNVGFFISGDTTQFKVRYLDLQTSAGYTASGKACAVLTGQPTETCVTADPALRTSAQVRLLIDYLPTTLGAHSLTITPTTDNGTALPAPLTLTGTGLFNATAAWSSDEKALLAPTNTFLKFGSQTPGTTTLKIFYVRHVKTHGALGVGFKLSGDVSQFRFRYIEKVDGSGYRTTDSVCPILSPEQTAICRGEDPSVGRYSNLKVLLEYVPTSLGNHSLTMTPISDNGTDLPAPLTLTGTSAFDPAAAWSMADNALTTPTAAFTNLGSHAIGTTAAKSIYLRNTGKNGALAVGFMLTGDVTQFKFRYIEYVNGSGYTSGGCSTLTGQPTAVCAPQDPSQGGYAHLRLVVDHIPTAAGVHSVTITPITNNGTVLPAPIVLTGTAQ